MRLGSIFYILGYGGAMLAIAMVLPLIMSLYGGYDTHTQNFIIGFLLVSFISGAMLLSGFVAHDHAHNLDLLLIMILFWLFLPIPAAIPITGALQIDNYVAGYFETVSGLTTSGASLLIAPQIETAPILVWRALLGWLGGLWIIVFGVAVLAPFAIGGVSLSDNPLLQHDERAGLAQQLGRPLRIIFPIYAGISALGCVVLWIAGMPLLDAFCLAVSAISTTGFVVSNIGLADMYAPIAQMMLAVLSFIGAMSMPVLLLMFLGRWRWRRFFGQRNAELRVFIAVILVYAMLSYVVLPQQDLFAVTLQSVSFASTAGFMFIPSDTQAAWPLIWMLILPIIGGCALSTAGGIKIIRVIMLAKDVARDIGQLIYPSAVYAMRLSGRRLELQDFSAAWAFLSIFLMLLMGGVLVASLFGLPFAQAWAVVASALTNSAAMLNMQAGFDLPALSDGLKIFIAALMIIGRVEFPVMLVLFTASFWRSIR